MRAAFRFRRFGTRLLILMVGLVASVQLATTWFVERATSESATDRILEDLRLGAILFQRQVDARLDNLSGGAALMSGDFAIRQLFLQDTLDDRTLSSALESYRNRIHVSRLVLIGTDGRVLAGAGRPLPPAGLEALRGLIQQAGAQEDEMRAKAFVQLPDDGKLCALLVVPLYAPPPQVVAWIGLVLPIDREFAWNLKQLTSLDVRQSARLEVTFVADAGAGIRSVESTLDEAQAAETAGLVGTARAAGMPNDSILGQSGGTFVTAVHWLPLATPGRACIVLQRRWADELLPVHRLERRLQALTAASLLVAVVLALGMARGVSQPLRRLAGHTALIARGDYRTRLGLDREDEIGQLGRALDRMSEGLEERDRVRDLLDRNVSPAVAAQLMRDGAALGGEEREVTVLFADLREFTKMAERLPPREVLALLNRYFDRISAVIEAQHGVVDKYIGDALMAVFGAPVAIPDAADRALDAAAGIRAAVVRLNRELEAEGTPGLAVGVGVNTARVVAGNMGSARRLNYSVVGDGVNVAARLQDLTRRADYAATVIVSASTLAAARSPRRVRSLGSTLIRGRMQPVDIFALDEGEAAGPAAVGSLTSSG